MVKQPIVSSRSIRFWSGDWTNIYSNFPHIFIKDLLPISQTCKSAQRCWPTPVQRGKAWAPGTVAACLGSPHSQYPHRSPGSYGLCTEQTVHSPSRCTRVSQLSKFSHGIQPWIRHIQTTAKTWNFHRAVGLTCMAVRIESCSSAAEKPWRSASTKAVCWPKSSSMAFFRRKYILL